MSPSSLNSGRVPWWWSAKTRWQSSAEIGHRRWNTLYRVPWGARWKDTVCWYVETIGDLLSHLWDQQKCWLEKVLRFCVSKLPNVHLLWAALRYWLSNQDFFCKSRVSSWVPGRCLELPWDHGKKQLRTASAVIWIPIEGAKNIFLFQLLKSTG